MEKRKGVLTMYIDSRVRPPYKTYLDQAIYKKKNIIDLGLPVLRYPIRKIIPI